MTADRIARLQAELDKRQIDCLALIPGYNLRYVTGLEFHLMERATILLIPAKGTPAFALPYLERTKLESLPGVTGFDYKDGEEPHAAIGQAVMAVPEIHTLAVEFLRMRVLELRLLQRHVPNAQIVDAQSVMDALRLSKTPEEIADMRQAVAIAERALANVLEWVRPGVTERQIAARLSIAMLEGGGGPEPFESIVLAGERAALPHGLPSDAVLKTGDALLFDFGTSYHGYISDITRTVFVGEPDEQAKKVYEAVKAANAAGRAAARPGVPCQEVDRAARKAIEEAGFGQYFTHRTGHGIGLEAHEGPYMVEGNTQTLEPGMCFTVEPGIYIPGQIGVRIEDNIVVTPDGAESLTSFPRDLTVIG